MLSLMDWADKFSNGEFESQRKMIREVMENPNHPYHPYLLHIINDIDPEVMKTTAVNLFINASLIGWDKQEFCRKNTIAIFHGQFCSIPQVPAICIVQDAGQPNMATS